MPMRHLLGCCNCGGGNTVPTCGGDLPASTLSCTGTVVHFGTTYPVSTTLHYLDSIPRAEATSPVCSGGGVRVVNDFDYSTSLVYPCPYWIGSPVYLHTYPANRQDYYVVPVLICNRTGGLTLFGNIVSSPGGFPLSESWHKAYWHEGTPRGWYLTFPKSNAFRHVNPGQLQPGSTFSPVNLNFYWQPSGTSTTGPMTMTVTQ